MTSPFLDAFYNPHAVPHGYYSSDGFTTQKGGADAAVAAAGNLPSPPTLLEPNPLTDSCRKVLATVPWQRHDGKADAEIAARQTHELQPWYTPLVDDPDAEGEMLEAHPSDCYSNWEAWSTASNLKKGAVYPQRLYHSKRNNPQKIRFFILVAGPPGSGKSTIALDLQKIATSINYSAAGFNRRNSHNILSQISDRKKLTEVYKRHGWIVLGHDQIICENEDIKKKICQKPTAAKDEEVYNTIRSGKPKKLSHQDSMTRRICANEWFNTGNCLPPLPPLSAAAVAMASPRDSWKADITKIIGLLPIEEEEDGDATAAVAEEASAQMRKLASYAPDAMKALREALPITGDEEQAGDEAAAVAATAKRRDVGDPNLSAVALRSLVAIDYWKDGVDDPSSSPRAMVRDAFGINDGEEASQFGTDMLLYTKLPYMINNGVNIVYETTFQHTDTINLICEQIYKQTNQCQDYQYIILLGFPIVNLATLQRRICDRSVETRTVKDCGGGGGGDDGGGGEDECTLYRSLQGGLHRLVCQMETSYANLIKYIWSARELPAAAHKGLKGIGVDLLYIYDNDMDMVELSQPLVPMSIIRLSDRSYKILDMKQMSKGATPVRLSERVFKRIETELKVSLECIRGVIENYYQEKATAGQSVVAASYCESAGASWISVCPTSPRGEDRESFREGSPGLEDIGNVAARVEEEHEKKEEAEATAATEGAAAAAASATAAAKTPPSPPSPPHDGGGRRTRKYRKKPKRRTRRR